MGQRLILSEDEKRNIQEMYGLINEQEQEYLPSCKAAGGFPKFLKDNGIKFNKTLDAGVFDNGVENGNFKDETKPSCYAFYGGNSSEDYKKSELKDYYGYDVRKRTFFKMKEEGVNETKTLNEEDKKLNLVNLVTKYRGGLTGFINQLNAMIDDDNLEATCSDLEGTTKRVVGKLDDFFNRISVDMGVKPEEAVKQLYDMGNNGLLTIIKPLIKAEGVYMSSEVLDLIENHMRTKYGQYGSALNSMLNDIYASSGVRIERFCKQQNKTQPKTFVRS